MPNYFVQFSKELKNLAENVEDVTLKLQGFEFEDLTARIKFKIFEIDVKSHYPRNQK
jgi:hypothetical protein